MFGLAVYLRGLRDLRDATIPNLTCRRALRAYGTPAHPQSHEFAK